MTEEQRNQFVERGAEWAVNQQGGALPSVGRIYALNKRGGNAARECFTRSGLGPFEEGPIQDAFYEGARAVFKVMGVI